MKTTKLTKYLPTHVSKYVYIGLVVIFLLLVIRTKWDKDGGIKVGEKFLIMSNYNKVVELTEEEKLGYEAEVQKYNDLINGVAMETETGENIAIQAVPDQTRFLYKSFNLSMLGRNNEAIKTIMDAQIYYPDSLSLMDFLARTYEQAGAYKMAAKTYEDIITKDPDKYMDYIRNIIHMYIALKDDNTAGKLYIEYITAGGEADILIVNRIRELRDMEPMKE